MQQPLVFPASEQHDEELQRLVNFYNETLGFCPNSVKTMYHRPSIAYAFIELNKAVMENKGRVTSEMEKGAIESGEQLLAQQGWTVGKHAY